ncbi:MAG: fibronectin type III domain-containing protein, partial [Pseudomonadota bacterium]
MKVPDGYLSTATTYQYRVRAVEQKEDKEVFSGWSPWMTFTTQKLIPAEKRCPADDDCDGIPNEMENQIKTSPTFKTLFVRPKKEIGQGQYRFWEEFNRNIFPTKAGGPKGRAMIPAFDLAGVEVVVIGDPDNPYEPMRHFNYDPEKDVNKPPCHIMEIIYHETYRRDGSPVVCEYGDSIREGHTWLNFYWIGEKFGYFWTWCTLGFTATKQTAYYIPEIYPLPINLYFEEGAYKCIEVGRKPCV